jgi:hypothetical protein
MMNKLIVSGLAIASALSLQAVELITSDGAWTSSGLVSSSNGNAQANLNANGVFNPWGGATFSGVNNENVYMSMQTKAGNPQQYYTAGYTYSYQSTAYAMNANGLTNQVAYLTADGETIEASRISGPNSLGNGGPWDPNTISSSFAVATGDAVVSQRIGLRLTSENVQSRFKADGLSGVSALLTEHANFNDDGIIYSTAFNKDGDNNLIADDFVLDMTLSGVLQADGYLELDYSSSGTKDTATLASTTDTFRENTTYQISFTAQKSQNNDTSQMDLSFELGDHFTTNIEVGVDMSNYEFKVDASAAGIAGKPLSIKITPAGVPAGDTTDRFLLDDFQLAAPTPAIELDGSATGDSVDEGRPADTLVGSLAVINANTTFSYSLVDSHQYPDNASFELTGSRSSYLLTADSFDYETKSSYRIRVQATETGPGSLVLTNTFTITVNEDEKQYFIIHGAPNQTSLQNREFPAMNPGSRRQVAFAPLLLPLVTPVEDLRNAVNRCLDSAEQSGYPVFFHLDDWNHTPIAPDQSPTGAEYQNDPEMVEWTAFPAQGEEHGPLLVRRWLNWGSWQVLGPSPNFESPKFRELMRERLADGIAKPIADRVAKWKQEGRYYLFAGIDVGWETGYYTMDHIAPGMLQGENNINTGYAALHARGHNAASVAQVAAQNGITVRKAHQLLMNDVKRDYTAFLTRAVHESGISKNRIYTHYAQVGFLPNDPLQDDGRASTIEATINDYSRTGFTGSATEKQGEIAELLAKHGRSKFGIVELNFFPDLLQEDYAHQYFNDNFKLGATMITIYGWWTTASGQPGLAAGIRRWLDEDDGIWSGPPPAGWSTNAMSGDADSGISTSKTYTHAVDLGDEQAASVSINGVPFHQGGVSGTDAAHGGSYFLKETTGLVTDRGSPVTGEMHELLDDFYYGGDPTVLYLNGLEAGSRYVTRFYVSDASGESAMDLTHNDSVRSVFRVDRSGDHFPGAIISYEGTAQAGGLLAFRAAQVGGAPRFHGFTVEKAAIQNETHLIADLFNTGVDAQGHLLEVGAADPHYTLSGPQLPATSPQAMVTIPNAAWNSGNEPFSRWIGPANGDVAVAGGTYIYTTTFTIEAGVIPATAQITGYLFADDTDVTVYLNGVRALSRSFPWNTDDTASYSRNDVVRENANAFSIVDGQNGGAGPVRFQTGRNTLVFSVPEVGVTPSGLRTYGMKGTVSSDRRDIPPKTVLQDSFDVPGGTWQEFVLQVNKDARQDGGAVVVNYDSANTNTQCLTQVYLTQTEDDLIGNGAGVLVMRNAPFSNGGTSIGVASAVINEDLAPSLAGNRYMISYSGVMADRSAAVVNNPATVNSWYHSVSLGGSTNSPGEPNQAGADLGFLIEWDGTAQVFADGTLLGSKVVPGIFAAFNAPFDVVLEIDEISMSASVSVEVGGVLTEVGTFDFDFDAGETARRLQFHSRLHTDGLPDNPGSFDAIVDAHVNDLKVTASVITKNHSIPHQWLTTVMGITSNYEEAIISDTDGDGLLAWEEYLSGTDPTSRESYLCIDRIEPVSTNIRLSWEHAAVDAGLPPIHLQWSPDLNLDNWVTIETYTPVDGVHTWDFVPNTDSAFFRLSVPNEP